jgi:hypothetical protein
MKTQPLDDLEMFELLQFAYPEKFPDDEDETFEAALRFAEELSGFEELADLLGRVVMLTMPMKSGLTERLSHCLGKVEFADGAVSMMAAAPRDVSPGSTHSTGNVLTMLNAPQITLIRLLAAQAVRELSNQIPKMKRADCARLLLEMSLVSETFVNGYNHGKPDHMLDMAASLEIDAAAIKTAVIAEMREKAKPKASKKVQPIKAKVQPNTAIPADTTSPLEIGDRVRVNATARSTLASVKIGKIGHVTSPVGDSAFMVAFTPNGSTLSYHRTELDKLPAESEPSSTPTKAAQAQGVSARPAAPAKTKGSAKAPKEPKAKAGTAATASPNEPAAPVENQLGKTAWPFPTGARI